MVIELSKLSETEWKKILPPSVHSLTHTHRWPLIHFGNLRENLPSIIPTWIELWGGGASILRWSLDPNGSSPPVGNIMALCAEKSH